MAGKLRYPDFDVRPAGIPRLRYVAKGAVLSRVYRVASGHNCLEWNPSRPPLSPRAGGRFDATDADPYLYLYLAEAHESNVVAIQETFRTLIQQPRAARARGKNKDFANQATLAMTELHKRALQRFTVSKQLTLLELTSSEVSRVMNVPTEVNTHPNRHKTREWARWIRLVTDKHVHGIAYNSTVESNKSGQHSIILWKDRFPARAVFGPAAAELPLSSPEGVALVGAALPHVRLI